MPEFAMWNPHRGRREPAPPKCLLTPTCEPRHACDHVHTHEQNKLLKSNKLRLNGVRIVCLSYFTELEWYIYLDASTWETAASLHYKEKLSQSFIIQKLNISLPCFWLIVPPEKPSLKHPYLRPRRPGHSARYSRPLLWDPPGRKSQISFSPPVAENLWYSTAQASPAVFRNHLEISSRASVKPCHLICSLWDRGFCRQRLLSGSLSANKTQN